MEIWFKQENCPRKPLRKKSDPKNLKKKQYKNKVKWPHVNKKTLARKRIFVQTPVSSSNLKLEQKNFTPENHSFFCSTSCSGIIKITTNLTSKNMKMCEQILKT